MQALFPGHSAFIVHSGRQFGARPTKLGKQEHTACVPVTLHCEFGPQGVGMHGFPLGSGTGARSKVQN